MDRTSPSEGGNAGSIPAESTNEKTALSGGRFLFLCFFEDLALSGALVELFELNLALYPLLILAGVVNGVGLGRLELYESIL